MPRKKKPSDEALMGMILECMPHIDRQDAAQIGRDIMAKIGPLVGEKADKTSYEADLREAYKEGYRDGQQSPRWGRWHTLIWRHSETFKNLRANEAGTGPAQETQSKYADYNF